MNILYLTANFPYPLTSGYLRHYFLIRELAQQHEITLLSLVGATFDAANIEALTPYTKRIMTVTSQTRGGSRRRKAINRLRSVVSQDSAIVQMRGIVEQLLRSERYDAIILSGKQTYFAVRGLPLPPLVADMCDATSMKIRGHMRYASPVKRLLLWWDWQQMRGIETKIIRSAQHLLFASARDCDVMMGGLAQPAAVIPNGVDLDYWKRSTSSRDAHTIIFTGAMNYAPNSDAALYLMRDIFPRVQQVVPDAKLLIVGHSPTPEVLQAGQRPGIQVTGFVDDMRPYLEQARVFAAPLRFGAGIQNKLLEAMALELAVVASPLAGEGLRTRSGESPPLTTADSADEFARAIVHELCTPASVASSEREYVQRHFSWPRGAAQLNEILLQIAKS
ncbi:MAG: glycosyltransferase [Chloroflexi bacterium]|uniref:glycosyltransferase n=1 Tax=Candidatus Flexifilum breve TaxID=3140694 RepID=UPI0031369994|nr:glycosyltransferase [Chloroflexota bacterium]